MAVEGLTDLGKCCVYNSYLIFNPIFIRLAGNEDSHKMLYEFDFGSDLIFHMRVTFHVVFIRHIMGKNIVRMIAISFLIGSSSNLQIRGTDIKSWTSLI